MNCQKLMDYIRGEISGRKKNSRENLDKSRSDFTAIRSLLKCAKRNSSDFEKLKTSQDTARMLRMIYLKNFEMLIAWAGEISEASDILVKLQKGDYQAVTSEDYKTLTDLSRGGISLTLLAVMNEFAHKCSYDFPARRPLLALLEIINPKYRLELYTELLSALLPSEQEQAASKASKELEELRAELVSTYSLLNASEESLERSRQEGAELALIDVMKRMNSEEAGMLIDQFSRAEQTLKQLSSSGYKIPSELASVPLCVRMFMRTMRDVFSVSPLHSLGEVLTITFEESISSYDYNGSDFEDAQDRKTVKVLSPGWKCGDEIFSLPKVIEVKN